jgi:hypothetical protein
MTTLADPESQYKSTQEKEHWTSKNTDLTWEHGETSDSRDLLEKAFPGEFERMLRMLSSTNPMRIVRELKKRDPHLLWAWCFDRYISTWRLSSKDCGTVSKMSQRLQPT